ncbi:hypothetical protein BH09SUM1_BH09SUM1_13370 [soil metagenome]
MIPVRNRFLLFLILMPSGSWLHAADYPPGDHAGANITLANGDIIWGKHTNVGDFHVVSGGRVKVRPYDPEVEASGAVQVFAKNILITGILDSSGAGFTGGGGGGGQKGYGWGPNGYNGVDGAPGHGRYPGFDGVESSAGIGDGPFGGGTEGSFADPFFRDGGYAAFHVNGDTTTDTLVFMGSGGMGTRGLSADTTYDGYAPANGRCYHPPIVFNGGEGGLAGGPGGGAISLIATDSMNVTGTIDSRGALPLSHGVNPTNGYCPGPWEPTCSCIGGNGAAGNDSLGTGVTLRMGIDTGAGAGGGVALVCEKQGALSLTGTIKANGGDTRLENGGSIKIFYNGDEPTSGTLISPRIYKQNITITPLPVIETTTWVVGGGG